MSAEKKLNEMLIDLPEPPISPDEFSYMTINGKDFIVSGIIPFAEGGHFFSGRAGGNVRVDIVKQAARSAVLQAIAIIRKEIGSLDKIKKIIKLEVYINSNPDFKDHRSVSDSASNLINEIFGAAGKHTQMVIGVPSLPRSSLVSISLEGELR